MKLTCMLLCLLLAACGAGNNAPANNPPANACGTSAELEPGSPGELAKRFMEAMLAQDTAAAVSCLREEEREAKDGEYNLNRDGLMKSYTLGKASVDGERATVPVTVTFKNDKPDDSVDLMLVKEDGEWRVHFMDTLMRMMNKGKED